MAKYQEIIPIQGAKPKVKIGDLVLWTKESLNKSTGVCLVDYDHIVSLADPSRVWSHYGKMEYVQRFIDEGKIEIAPSGTKVTLEQE